MKCGILGYGEAGKAIAKFYKNPLIKDLNRDDGLKGVDVLHICIPWSKDFIKIVKKEIREIKPKLTIIHSTVKVGTTKKIGGRVVHSPVKGVHPHLYEGIKTFIKYVGTDKEKAGQEAKAHLISLGLDVKVFRPSAITEAIKLWETTQSVWGIVLQKLIKKWCDEKKLDFDIIYTEANKEFNRGYTKLGYPNECFPIFRNMEGKIGGHCLIQNCKLLDSEVAKYVLKQNESF